MEDNKKLVTGKGLHSTALFVIGAVAVIFILVSISASSNNSNLQPANSGSTPNSEQPRTTQGQSTQEHQTQSQSSDNSITYTKASLYTLKHNLNSIPTADSTSAYFVDTSGTVVSSGNFQAGKEAESAVYIKDGGDDLLILANQSNPSIVGDVQVGDTVEVEGIFINPTTNNPGLCDPTQSTTLTMCRSLGARTTTPFVMASLPITIVRRSNSGIPAAVSR